ncbi:tRNA 2-thiouridine(34) synthase MnmA [Gammaproteobacteria bacterium]|nr:tRNA 2-thiouridine(34) synthase MnmA [Gammaproteobacteria bacterium]
MNKEINNKIIVGISGGVDSSVTAMLLKEQGYEVEGLFMKNWNDTTKDGSCLWENDVEDAMMVCDKLDIPLNTVDLSSDYWDKVFKNFIKEYKNGRTPNPDVLCNQEIKFKVFLEHAENLGASKIATGHYARIHQQANSFELLKGLDLNKDQSYFLCRLNQTQLEKSMFPIGELDKTEVRLHAEKAGLITHDKKDSTGICFIGEQPFRQFLSRYITPDPGSIKTIDEKIIGEHDGVFYYTLGQRQGLGIGGVKGAIDAPWYVVQKNIEENELIVVQDHDHPLLHSRGLMASSINWISEEIPDVPYKCQAKNRYRQADQSCTIEKIDNDSCSVSFDLSQRAITPGQFIVFYKEDACLGGGIIDSVD